MDFLGIIRFTSILALGGETFGSVATDIVDEFMCQLNSWSTDANMLAAREAHAGGLLPNGMVIVSHGFINSPPNTTSTAELFDPLLDTWTSTASASVARGSVGGDVLNGLFYVMGGSDSTNTPLTTVEIYNPVTNTWSTGTPLLSARSKLAVVSLNGLLYAIGGFNGV